MKKRLLAIFLVLVAGVVFGAGQQDGDSGFAGNEKIVFTLGTQDNPGTVTAAGLEAAKSELERLSGGTMSIDIFYSSQLGDYKAMVGQVTAGELDMTMSGFDNMSFIIPKFGIFGYPYVVNDYAHLLRILKDDFAEDLLQELKESEDIILLDVWNIGARHVTSNKPLNSAADFKGLKLRTPNVATTISFAESVGAVASPIAFAEVYLALQTNQVEAQENPLTTIDAMKFYEVQKYMAMTAHILTSNVTWMSSSKYDALTDKQKAWLRDAFIVARATCNGEVEKQEAVLLEKFKSAGVTISYPDLEPFKKAMAPYYKKLETEYGAGIIERIQNL